MRCRFIAAKIRIQLVTNCSSCGAGNSNTLGMFVNGKHIGKQPQSAVAPAKTGTELLMICAVIGKAIQLINILLINRIAICKMTTLFKGAFYKSCAAFTNRICKCSFIFFAAYNNKQQEYKMKKSFSFCF